jgi:hypothetical protein
LQLAKDLFIYAMLKGSKAECLLGRAPSLSKHQHARNGSADVEI